MNSISLRPYAFVPHFNVHQNSFNSINHLFQKIFGIEDDRIFQKTLDQAKFRFGCSIVEPLSENSMRRIEKALKETLVYSGKGIDPQIKSSDPKIHEIVQYLLGKGNPSSDWVDKKNVMGILLKKDPHLLRAMQEEFRSVLQACAEMSSTLKEKDEVVFNAFVSNVIALLPYCYLEEGLEFVIPQKIDGKWKKCVYRVEKKLELTPKWLSSPIPAYGLTSADGPPLLAFLGTTYPSGEGFFATLLSDFTPGMSVGQAPYLLGKKKITQWLEKKEKVRLFGMSLGGALALHVLRNHRDKIDTIEAFNPPGLYPWNFKERFDDRQTVNIYCQDNDLVSTMGMFPEGKNVSIYRVFSTKTENPLLAHARVYTGGDQVTILKSDPHFENSRGVRKILTGLHLILGMVLVFLPLLCFYLLYLILAKPILSIHAEICNPCRSSLSSLREKCLST